MKKFMMIVKATAESEAGKIPSAELFAAMGKFNEEMVNAGVLLAADGLASSAKGARVRFAGDKRSVIDGPFAETKELVAGFWIIQAKSLEEAVAWARRSPHPMPDGDGEAVIEVRQIMSMEDFGPMLAESK
ncbi:MAG TPA: YciI family protein [Gemmatimonadales bacterium]